MNLLFRSIFIAFCALTVVSQAADAQTKALVLLCKGTQHCESCAQTQADFDWTYTIDFTASTVDGKPANISDETITWQINSDSVLDDREISRYSKKFHFAGKAVSGGGEIYYGDGVCEPQEHQAF
jgi:hypothetical protein